MAVEPRLADDHARPAAVPRAPRRHACTHRLGARRVQTEPLAEDGAQRIRPLPGRDPRPCTHDRGGHQVRAGRRRVPELAERAIHVGLAPPALRRAQHVQRLGCRDRVELEEATVLAGEQGRRQTVGPAVAADDHHLALVDARQALRLAAHEPRLHVARLDRRERTARLLDARDLRARRVLQGRDLRRHHRRAREQIGVLEEIGLVGQDLLEPERPLLIPRPRQAERLVPRRELERPAAGVAAEGHAERLEQDAPGVVLRLLLGEAERVHLHAVAEEAVLRVLHAVAVAGDLVPHLDERPHLAHLLDEPDAGIHEERDAADRLLELLGREAAPLADGVEDGHGVGEREGQLLRRRRPRLLQVVRADVRGVPPRDAVQAVIVHIDDQPHRVAGWEDVRPARQVLLDEVVLRRALEHLRVDAPLLGERDVEREQPHGRRVDGHRRVDLLDRDAVEEDVEVVDGVDRDADLADLGLGDRVVGAVAALGGEIEGDREPGLATGEVTAVEGIRLAHVRVPGIRAEDPGLVARGVPVLVVEEVWLASHAWAPTKVPPSAFNLTAT